MHDTADLPLVDAGASVGDAILVMTNKGFGCAGVVDSGGQLTGIITDGDLRRHMSDALLQLTCADIMTPDPKTIRAQARFRGAWPDERKQDHEPVRRRRPHADGDPPHPRLPARGHSLTAR